MLSQFTLINRFANGAERGAASHMFIEGDVIYSYGYYFPLAIRHDWGAGVQYLLNGDRCSVSTSSHQHLCIGNRTPNVQVPFSALHAADLTNSTLPRRELRIVAHRPDEYHTTCKHCGREVHGAYGTTDDPSRWAYRHVDDSTPLCPESESDVLTHHVLGAVVLTTRRL